jgi:multidrug efflux pump subunit AcrA (membrane-fusion protein)
MTVTAPRDGTVVYVADWRGEKPRVGESTWRAEKLISIPDLTRLAAVARVPETELGRVDEGMPVGLRLDAHPDLEYRGTVLRLSTTVGAQARNDPRKVARADIELERIDPERMRPGMRFRAEIERERIAGVLRIPLDAVRHDERKAYVLRRTWRGTERVEPSFGRRSTDEVEVLDGLEAGDRLVLDPREEAR